MITRNGREKLKKFLIILDSGCISTIVMGSPVEKLHPEKDEVLQCHTQSGNVTTNHKVKVHFALPTLSATNFVMCKCHVDDSSKCRYNMIIG